MNTHTLELIVLLPIKQNQFGVINFGPHLTLNLVGGNGVLYLEGMIQWKKEAFEYVENNTVREAFKSLGDRFFPVWENPDWTISVDVFGGLLAIRRRRPEPPKEQEWIFRYIG